MLFRYAILIIIISYTHALTQIRSDFMISDSGRTPFFNFDNNGNIHLIYGNGYACYSALTESGETLFEKLKLGSSNYDAFTPTLDINGDLIACVWESRKKPPVFNFSTYIKSRIISNGQAITEEIKVNDAFGDAYRKNPVIIWHNDSTLFAVWAGNGSQSQTQNSDIYYKKLFLNPFRLAYTSDRIIDNSKLNQDEFRPSIIKKKYSEGYFIVRLEEDSLGTGIILEFHVMIV